MDEACQNLVEVLEALPDVRPEFPSWGWLAELDAKDLAELVAEFRALLAAENMVSMADAVLAWERSAEALSDPLFREIISKPFDPADYIEVSRPGGEADREDAAEEGDGT
jgi:hypothetical protein